MKKLILAIAAIAISCGFAVKADNQKTECAAKACKEQACATACEKKGDKKCDKKCDKPCDKKAMKGCEAGACNPFEGLNLTDAQKQQLKDLRQKEMQQVKDKKADKKQAKDAKKADRKAAKQARLAEIKKILTPEQYTKFLENSLLNSDKQQFNGRMNGQRPQHPQGHQRPQGQRPERPVERQQR